VRILIWHVHGSWTTAFVQGGHEYLIPVLPERGAWGGGRPQAWDWPARAVEVSPYELADAGVDVVVVQRPEEMELAARWLRRVPGRDLPAVYLEHNAPRGPAATSRHPVAARPDLLLVHVTHFNALMWDAGSTPTAVVEHGVIDPGHRYTGELAAAATSINEPVRRGRITGTDLLPGLAGAAPIDVFGMGLDGLPEHLRDELGVPEAVVRRIRPVGDLPQGVLHTELARRRAYLHTPRWTSLGLSLIEAMMLGMPVVVLDTTEAAEAVPDGVGVRSTNPDRLREGLRDLVADPAAAAAAGRLARRAALRRYGLDRFLADWDDLLARVVPGAAGPTPAEPGERAAAGAGPAAPVPGRRS
jgi:hypothetical protein